MNMFVFCHQVFRSKVFDSENMFVYISVCLVIYKLYIYMDLLMVGLFGCPCKVPSLRIIS